MASIRASSPVQVPLLIGVTGHRDLLREEIAPLRAAVRSFLARLQGQFPNAPPCLASSLAAGADLLVTEEALNLGIECIAVLPLPLDEYRKDFENPDELRRFEAVLARCRPCIVCPLKEGVELDDLAAAGPARTEQYALAGEIIAGASFILLALWDGRLGVSAGGTADTVEFRLSQRAWLDSSDTAHQDLLPNLQPDLVYHIVTSRRIGAPVAGLTPLQEGYRCGPDGPLEVHLPASAQLVAERTAQLNRDLSRHAASISRDLSIDELTGDLAAVPPSVVETARLFSAIDWVAGRMRRNVMATLYATSALTVFMGISLLGYSHREYPHFGRYIILGFVLAFLTLLGINLLAGGQHWHRRYLEWRALAEGLRVELFWGVAGVTTSSGTPAVHRALLKQADPGLEWIPNALRAVSLRLAGLRHTGIVGGIDFAMRNWVGTINETGSRSQQLHYYWHASRAKAAMASFAEGLATWSVGIGFVIAIVLVIEEFRERPVLHSALLFSIGFLALLGAVLESLGQKTAQRELQRQYEYMYAVFLAAHDRLTAARTDAERRAILALLGRAALEEHAQWLLVHRDRPIDRSRLQ